MILASLRSVLWFSYREGVRVMSILVALPPPRFLPWPLHRRCRWMLSNPMPVREEWNPIHAEESLTAAFERTAVSGQWTLRLRDTTASETNEGVGRAAINVAHGDGGVAGWEVRGKAVDALAAPRSGLKVSAMCCPEIGIFGNAIGGLGNIFVM